MTSQPISMRNIYLLLGGGLAVFFIVLLVGIMNNPSTVTTSVVRPSGPTVSCGSGAVLSVNTATPYVGDTISASYLFPAGTNTSNLSLLWNITDGNPAQVFGSYAEKNKLSFTVTSAGTKTVFVGQTSGTTYNPLDPSCSVEIVATANTGACSEGGAIAFSKRNVKIGETVSATLPATVPTSGFSVNWTFQDGQAASPTPNPPTGSTSNLRTVNFALSRAGTKTITAQIYPTGSQWNPSDAMCSGTVSVTESVITPKADKSVPVSQ